jgi:hypothetical protein
MTMALDAITRIQGKLPNHDWHPPHVVIMNIIPTTRTINAAPGQQLSIVYRIRSHRSNHIHALVKRILANVHE